VFEAFTVLDAVPPCTADNSSVICGCSIGGLCASEDTFGESALRSRGTAVCNSYNCVSIGDQCRYLIVAAFARCRLVLPALTLSI